VAREHSLHPKMKTRDRHISLSPMLFSVSAPGVVLDDHVPLLSDHLYECSFRRAYKRVLLDSIEELRNAMLFAMEHFPEGESRLEAMSRILQSFSAPSVESENALSTGSERCDA
jgi:hypothetical protein